MSFAQRCPLKNTLGPQRLATTRFDLGSHATRVYAWFPKKDLAIYLSTTAFGRFSLHGCRPQTGVSVPVVGGDARGRKFSYQGSDSVEPLKA